MRTPKIKVVCKDLDVCNATDKKGIFTTGIVKSVTVTLYDGTKLKSTSRHNSWKMDGKTVDSTFICDRRVK